jgi:hypothetical protein
MAMEEHVRDAGTWYDVYSERYANELVGLDDGEYPATVGTPGADDEYFMEDYDDVHCVHGAFIGYPGGADFMCGLCENGQVFPKQDRKWELHIYGRIVWTVYKQEDTAKWDSLIALCKKEDVSYNIIQQEYTWWDTEE